ncbi:MAG: ABC transporter permease, partial [Acidobacteriota bacterium]
MNRYFLRSLAAHFRAGRSLFLLTLLGVAVGVASVLSIQIINLNALGAFRGSLEAISGEADLSIVSRAPALPEEVYPQALAFRELEGAWPLYRVDVALEGRKDFYLEVVGVDLFAPVKLPWKGSEVDLSGALGELGWVAVTPSLAEEMGWQTGERFAVSSGSRRVELVVGALVDFQKVTPLASSRLAVMDIAQAQGLFGRRGEIHQVDLKVRESVDRAELAKAIAARLGPGVRVLTPEQREQQAADLLGAFRLNLTALSFISLFVGGFLVYSSTQAALVRRRKELGLLRSLGATRRQVLGLILGEVSFLGLLGVALGVPLGYLAATSSVEDISRTISNIYLLEEIEQLHLPAWLYLLALGTGVAGAVAGALLPAWDVSRRDTRSLLAPFTLHERVGAAALPLFFGGFAVMALAMTGYAASGEDWRARGFVLAVGLLLALPLVTPLLVQQGARIVRVHGFGFAFGLKGLGLELHSTPLAISALGIAVSMMIGITVMVGSFRSTVEVWVRSTLRADVYITTPSWRRARREATLAPELVSAIASHPGVRAVDRLRQFFLYLGERRITLAGVDMGIRAERARFDLLAGKPEEALRRAREEGAVLIGEPLARKEKLGLGDRLTVTGPEGEVSFPVAGIYYDYGNESGSALLDLATVVKHFGPGEVSNLALYLEPGRDPEKVGEELKSRFSGLP